EDGQAYSWAGEHCGGPEHRPIWLTVSYLSVNPRSCIFRKHHGKRWHGQFGSGASDSLVAHHHLAARVVPVADILRLPARLLAKLFHLCPWVVKHPKVVRLFEIGGRGPSKKVAYRTWPLLTNSRSFRKHS